MLDKIIGVFNLSNTLVLCVTGIEYDINDSVMYFFNHKPEKSYKRKIYFNKKGEPFIITQVGRIYLKDIVF